MKKNWISKATKNKDALHKALGVKQGDKIPLKKINKAVKGNGKVAKEARLAKTLRSFKK